jgi:hypothetical protein
MKTISRTVVGPLSDGVIVTNSPLLYLSVFVDDPMNLLGVRKTLKFFLQDDVLYKEISYFMENLLMGDTDSFTALLAESNEYETYEWEILKKEKDKFVTNTMVKELLRTVDNWMNSTFKKETLINQFVEQSEGVYKQRSYSQHAYLAVRDLAYAKQALTTGTIDPSKLDLRFAQAVCDGKVEWDILKKFLEENSESVKTLLQTSFLDDEVDLQYLNELVYKVRNVKITMEYEQD